MRSSTKPFVCSKQVSELRESASFFGHSHSHSYPQFRVFSPLNTVCQWIVGVLNRNTNGNIIEYFDLLPYACRLERCEQDVEMAETCSSLLAMLSQGLTLQDCMGYALQKIDDVSLLSSWSARLAVIDVLQVLVFNNMPIVLSRDDWVQQVQTIVLRLLEDAVLEVRVKAAQVLGGLLHCSFLPSTDKLLELFKQKCRTKVTKNSARRMVNGNGNGNGGDASETTSLISETQEAEAVRVRHMGVLGLCSFISAYPYDIPDFIPDIFEHLGAHLNDPQPIPVSSTAMTIFIYLNSLYSSIYCGFSLNLSFSSRQSGRLLAISSEHIMIIGQCISSNSPKTNWPC